MKKVPITRPFFGEEEREAILDPLTTGWVVQGPHVREFEEKVAQYTGATFAKATTSCTTALHLALLACGVESGDEVIIPSFTFVATANAVVHAGARPVFVDIDLATYNLDASKLEAAVTKKTKAVIPVHLFGLCADMDRVMEIAGSRGIKVVEDAACAIGSAYKGRHAGTIGDAGCLSFHARKIITTGEGGMVLTNSAEISRMVEKMRDHGGEISDLKRHERGITLMPSYEMLGFNYRMTDLQGAVGAVQMDKLESILSARRALAQRYRDRLGDLEWLRLPQDAPDTRHSYQSFVCLFAPEGVGADMDRTTLARLRDGRDKLMAELARLGVETRQGTHAVHNLGYHGRMSASAAWDLPNSLIAESLTITLPLYPQMQEEEQDYVIEAIRRM